ncbi:extensin-like [Portunus trituberculatus]|uniref:extensin-like n=1 Tax=Portunus trituberculatus TaxID=210409 RepID=UPI001E1CB4A8|nr:extensin-like [Portunus trituberculatus]
MQQQQQQQQQEEEEDEEQEKQQLHSEPLPPPQPPPEAQRDRATTPAPTTHPDQQQQQQQQEAAPQEGRVPTPAPAVTPPQLNTSQHTPGPASDAPDTPRCSSDTPVPSQPTLRAPSPPPSPTDTQDQPQHAPQSPPPSPAPPEAPNTPHVVDSVPRGPAACPTGPSAPDSPATPRHATHTPPQSQDTEHVPATHALHSPALPGNALSLDQCLPQPQEESVAQSRPQGATHTPTAAHQVIHDQSLPQSHARTTAPPHEAEALPTTPLDTHATSQAPTGETCPPHQSQQDQQAFLSSPQCDMNPPSLPRGYQGTPGESQPRGSPSLPPRPTGDQSPSHTANP